MFHHGTKTNRQLGGSVPVDTVDSAIIGIVGTAPMGAVNELTLCQTKKDFSKFGVITGAGFTLPDAFDILARYAAGKVYVVNVLDPTKHKTTISDESLTLEQGSLRTQTKHPALLSLTLTAQSVNMVKDQDYRVNMQTGEIVFTQPRTEILATYTYADPSKVTEADIKGGIESSTGQRTGFELLRNGFTLFGSDAKILICPGFDKSATIAASLETLAEQLKAVVYIQLPKGTLLSQALSARGPEGHLNASASSERVRHFCPYVKGTMESADHLESLAVHAAGLRMKVDVEKGYWFSSSNHSLLGVTGLEYALTARIDDIQSETNLLNAQGITTVFNSFGTGFRLWGNRSSCYPSVTHLVNFETALRTGDLIDESIRRTELQFIDQPIDDALIDALLATIETYMGTLKSIVGFSVMLDPDADLVDSFSRGLVPIKYEFTPKLPAELIENTSVMSRKYLINLVGEQ